MSKHALLSASSSHRWLNCPPSARLCERYEDKGSGFAAEGTDAHTLCEYKLKVALGICANDPISDLTHYNAEMEDCTNGYADYILELVETARQSCGDPIVLIEQQVGKCIAYTNLHLYESLRVLLNSISMISHHQV